MTLTEKQITDRLVAAHAAYAERTGKQPYIGMKIIIDSSDRITATYYGDSINDHHSITRKTIKGALDALDGYIAAIPSEAERLRIEAAKAVGTAIEKCRAAGYDPEFVNPLIEMSKRISENAIPMASAAKEA